MRVGNFARYFSITHYYIKAQLFVLILLNVIAAGVEGVGILMFLPFLSQLTGIPVQPKGMTGVLQDALTTLHIPVCLGSLLVTLVILFAMKGLFVFCFNAFRPFLFNQAGCRIREDLLRQYADADYRYSFGKNSGYFANLLVSETERACSAMDSFCRSLASLVTCSILFLVAVICYGSVSLMVLAAGGMSLLFFRSLSRKKRDYSIQLSALNDRLHAFLIQALQSVKYLKSTSGFPHLQKRITEVNEEGKVIRNRMAVIHSLRLAVEEPVIVITLAIILYFAIVVSGSSAPIVTVAILFLYRCLIELGYFHNHWQLSMHYSGGLEAVWKARTELDLHKEATGFQGVALFRESIEFDDVGYEYDSLPVLRDVNFRIVRNQSVAFVGLSGAGKTTLVDLITGLLKPTHGTVRIDQEDLRALNLAEFRRRIGYVGQDPVIFDDTIASNITMLPDENLSDDVMARLERAAQDSYCEEFIRLLPDAYRTRVGERGVKLSGGQRQRLAIARELFRDPQILILDEATSSLDSQSEKAIQENIERLQGTLTLIIISHRLSTIHAADQVFLLDSGTIVDQGTFQELLLHAHPVFIRMCQHQRLL